MRRRFALLPAVTVAFGLVQASPMSAQDPLRQSLAQCAVINSAVERLDCFDAIVQDLGESPTEVGAPTGAKYGKWQVTEDVNPLDDSRTVFAVLIADEGRSRMGDEVTLVLRCMSGQLETFIGWNGYMGSDRPRVTTRIGIEDPQTDRWSLSSDNTATFFPGDPRGFIYRLFSAERLVAQATPYSESPITAVFDLTGISDVVTQLEGACPP